MTCSRPLALTDHQFSAVYQACEPLAPTDRDAFLPALAHRLSGEVEFGDGVVGRAIKELQRTFWRPPTLEEQPRSRRVVGEPIA